MMDNANAQTFTADQSHLVVNLWSGLDSKVVATDWHALVASLLL